VSDRIHKSSFGLLLVMVFWLSGCGDNNPIGAFEPEIFNNADSFQFQITEASNVTTTLSYTWINDQSGASIDHSTARTAGVAAVSIFDADSIQVYSSDLLASGTEPASQGVPGNWTIVVSFVDFDGTVNFRVEKL